MHATNGNGPKAPPEAPTKDDPGFLTPRNSRVSSRSPRRFPEGKVGVRSELGSLGLTADTLQ
eukprot:8307158-Alexandrium_andersonii.AAC.1